MLLGITGYAQTFQVSGKIIDNQNIAIESAEALLVQNGLMVQHALSDENGSFAFNAASGDYTLLVKQLGDTLFSQAINLTHNIDLGTITVQQAKELQEVTVTAHRKRQYADKSVYTFDAEAVEKARYAKDLVLALPEVQLDPVSNTIQSIKGGKLLILINGMEASDMQLRSVQPENVVRIEYYDIPPARWATRADIVVNLTVRSEESGYVFGANAVSAFNTGFLIGSAYADFTKKRNNFGIEYSINLRNYNNREVNQIYNYLLNDEQYNTYETRRDHFGYTDQFVTLRYTNMLEGNYAFQAKFNMQIFSSFSNGKGQSVFSYGSLTENHSTVNNDSSEYIAPSLDWYFSKNISKKDLLSFNLVGSHYTTNSSQFDKEWVLNSNQSIFDNDMTLKAKQTGIVGELAYVHTFEMGNLSSGYRVSNTNITNDLNNLAGNSNYTVNYLEQYLYAEFSGKKDKLMYRISAGLTNIHNKSAETVFDEWAFTPKLGLGYQLKDNQSIRLTSSYSPRSPWSAALSNNVVQLAPNIVRRGNPLLKSQHAWNNNLTYSLNNKYFDFNATVFYYYQNRTINQYYVKDETFGGYALTYENAQNSQEYGLQISGSVKPFGNDWLVIKSVLVPTSESVKTRNGALIKNNYLWNNFVLASQYKQFRFQYQFNIPVYTLSGAFLSTNENQNHLFASYNHKSWTFYTGMYWIGMTSEYRTKSLPESIVNDTAHAKIHNNNSMFVLGLSYDFSLGKQNNLQKNLENNTAPAATF
ncbi:hypothetical protein FACS189429_5830 [Bacteroidia bacterium]|nr:hypothetical protein FACS189429_5830 [Bacteroidia bacterium]